MRSHFQQLLGRVLALCFIAAAPSAVHAQATISCQLPGANPPPGSSLACDLYLTDAPNVRSYQTRIAIVRTSGTGTVTVTCPGGVTIDGGRGDYLFAGQSNVFPAINCAQLKASSSLLTGGVSVGGTPAYLSSYQLTVSPDAVAGSTFEISVLPLNGSNGSLLADSTSQAIPFLVSSPCVLTVAAPTLAFVAPAGSFCVPPAASIDVALNVSNLTEAVNGAQVRFAYDPALLSLFSVTAGDGLGSPWDGAVQTFFNDASGNVSMGYVLLAGSANGNSRIATLHFQAIASPGSPAISFLPPNPPFDTKLTRAGDSTPIFPNTVNSGAIALAANPMVTILATPSDAECAGEVITLDAGAGFSSYLWSPGGETTQSIDVTTGGTYAVTVTNASGCFGGDSIDVTFHATPVVSIIATPASLGCQGDVITLDAGAGYSSYLWSPGGETTQTIDVTAGGSYSVAVVDANGCAGADSIEVTINQPPVIGIVASPSDEVCDGEVVTLDAGAGFSSYLWSPGGETTQTIDVTAGGTYGVTVVDANGCEAMDSIDVTVHSNPVVTITASPDDTAYVGETITLDAGAGFSSYLWSPGGETTQSIDVTSGGTYGVTVTDVNGCEGADSIEVAFIANPTLTLNAPAGPFCTPTDSSFDVTVTVSGLVDAINGAQIIVDYDTALISLSSATSGDGQGSPWDSAAQTFFEDDNGHVTLALVIVAGQTSADAVVATLHFNIVSAPGSTSVSFSPPNPPFQTKLTRASDNAEIFPTTVDSGSIALASDPVITIVATPGETVCTGTTVTLDAGGGYSAYLWSPGGETTQTIEVTASGAYSVVATDANGCQGSDSIDIVVGEPMAQIVATPAATVCFGTSVMLDAGAGFSSYLWSPGGQTTQTINVVTGGTYSVTVTDGNGCMDSDSIEVTVNPSPAVTIVASPDHSACAGATITLDAGAGFTSYLWSPGGETTQTIEVTTGGTYSVIVTDANSCVGNDSIDVTFNANPVVTIVASPGESVCAGETVTLDAGAGYASYLWSPGGEITQTIDVTVGGTYSVAVVDGNGCGGSDDIDVTFNANPSPTIVATPAATGCVGDTITLDAGDGYAGYLWTPGGEITRTIEVTAGGTYAVTVTDGNGCQGSDSIEVTLTSPSVSIVATPGDTVCDGETITLDAGAGFASYLWSPGGETSRTIDVTTGGTYSVVVTDGNGCEGGDSIDVIFNPAPTPEIIATPGDSVCQGGTITLDAGAGYTSYLWSPGGETTQTIDVTVGGTYGVTVTDGNGCEGSDEIIVTVHANPAVTIVATPGVSACAGSAITLDAGAGYASYLWSPGGETTQTIEVTSAGNYSVAVVDANGCNGSDDIDVTFNANPAPMIVASPGQVVCNGTTVTLDAGAGYAGYLWSPGGETTQTIEVTVGGNYSVSVTDGNGCSGGDSIVITVNASLTPTILATPGAVGCAGETITLDAGAGFASYLWSPGGETTRTIEVSTAGTYGVTVSDGNGCDGADSIDITFNPAPTVTIAASPSTMECSGEDITLDAGAGFASYLWSPGGQTTRMIHVTSSGTYSVTVSNGFGCTASDDIDITVFPSPDCTITMDATFCRGTAGHEASVADAGPGATYTWGVTGGSVLSGQGTPSIIFQATSPDTVAVFVTIMSANGCSCLDVNIGATIPHRCGDLNNDSLRDGEDVQLFADAILNAGSPSESELCAADMDLSGDLDTVDDVALFVNCLLTGACNCNP